MRLSPVNLEVKGNLINKIEGANTMSETIKRKTYKKAERIASCLRCGKSIPEGDRRAAIHFIAASCADSRQAIGEMKETILDSGLDMNAARNIYDYYRARLNPMQSFLLRLQDDAL